MKKRRYLVLTSNPESESTKRIVKEGRNKGHEMAALTPQNFCIHMENEGGFRVTSKSEEGTGTFNGVIPRGIGNDYGLSLLNVLILIGMPSANSPKSISTAGNKLACQITLTQHHLRQPKATSIWGPDQNFKKLVDSVGGLPCIVKPWKGSQGDGVNIFMNEMQSKISLSNMRKKEMQILLQQYIETSSKGEKKSDLRIFVIDGKVVAAYKRYSVSGDVRSNYSLSKHGENVEITKEEESLAIDAAKCIGLGISGIDIARETENKTPYIIEANSSPGLTGVEAVTGVNVARLIIDFMDRIADSLEPTRPTGGKGNYGSATIESFVLGYNQKGMDSGTGQILAALANVSKSMTSITYDKKYNSQGYDKEGYDVNGLDKNGLDRDGKDKDGFVSMFDDMGY